MQEKLRVVTVIIDFIRTRILNEGTDFELSPEEDLLGSGLIGSMEVFQLIEFVEQEFLIRVAPEDMTIEHFSTVVSLTKFIQEKKI